jgi:hypothetical protein
MKAKMGCGCASIGSMPALLALGPEFKSQCFQKKNKKIPPAYEKF